ncbi:MAG: hypothetical protein M1821_007750 [Bathelium mastoideum]|nr:MAG: hypothetical protein M1821_007750 [Bathelium mastoideum]
MLPSGIPVQQGMILNDLPQTRVSASHAEQSLPSTSPADTEAHTGRNDCPERTPAEPSSRSLEDIWSDEIGAKQTNSSDEASTESSSGPRVRFFDVNRCLKWFSQNGLTYALALTTLIMTAVALWPATDAKNEGDLANALSVWTAKKDFIVFCADQANSDCNLADNVTLPAPPKFSGQRKRWLGLNSDELRSSVLWHIPPASVIGRSKNLSPNSHLLMTALVSILAVFVIASYALFVWRRWRIQSMFAQIPRTTDVAPDQRYAHVIYPKEGFVHLRAKSASTNDGQINAISYNGVSTAVENSAEPRKRKVRTNRTFKLKRHKLASPYNSLWLPYQLNFLEGDMLELLCDESEGDSAVFEARNIANCRIDEKNRSILLLTLQSHPEEQWVLQTWTHWEKEAEEIVRHINQLLWPHVRHSSRIDNANHEMFTEP